MGPQIPHKEGNLKNTFGARDLLNASYINKMCGNCINSVGKVQLWQFLGRQYKFQCSSSQVTEILSQLPHQ